jgi:hypothetical protein
MKVNRELAEFIIDEDATDWRPVKDTILETGRWDVLHLAVYKHNDKFYEVAYRVGATEYQEQTELFDEPGDVEFFEVEPKQVTVTKYVRV